MRVRKRTGLCKSTKIIHFELLPITITMKAAIVFKSFPSLISTLGMQQFSRLRSQSLQMPTTAQPVATQLGCRRDFESGCLLRPALMARLWKCHGSTLAVPVRTKCSSRIHLDGAPHCSSCSVFSPSDRSCLPHAAAVAGRRAAICAAICVTSGK